jgi:serine/threonine protein kinase
MSDLLFDADELSLEAEAEIDRICDRFEAAWRAGSRPGLEDFWTLPDEPARTRLLRELLQLEVYYRVQSGETLCSLHYQSRFPGFEETVRAVLDSRRETWTPAGVRSDTGRASGPITSSNASPAGDLVIPGYEIVGELGRGGMGVVYQAKQTRLGRLVALKVIHGAGPLTPEVVRRFEAEAGTVARFDHPNIVRVYDSGEHGGVAYLALEFVAGGNLAQRLQSGPWPARQAAELVGRLADAVEVAHRQNVIHRDLKPANILLTEDGTPKIADFGLARLLDQVSGTVGGELLGTPRYMSPEQADGRQEAIGPATDVFGLGAILYELLTGQAPLQGSTVGEVLREARDGRVRPPRMLQPRIPRALERICLKALSADPACRQRSADELARELRWFLGQRRRWLLAGGGLIAVSLVALLGWLLGSRSVEKEKPAGELELQRPGSGEPGSPATRKEKLSGELIVEVWSPEKDGRKQGWRVDDPRALPVRAGELLHIRGELSEPAHVYLLLLSSQGEVVPLYPWNEEMIQQKKLTPPPERSPVQSIHSPTSPTRTWPLDNEDGLETVLLLARRTPLPESVDLAALIGQPPRARLRNPREWAVRGGDEGEAVDFQDLGRERGIRSESVEVDEPLLQVMSRLRPHFEVVKAVRFAHQGG